MTSCEKLNSNYPLSQDGENLLKNCVITFSHIEMQLRDKLNEQIIEMKGKVVRELRKSVTHIISDDWYSKKCIYARKHKSPMVMRFDWIDACWEMKLSSIHFSPDNFLEYKLPIFHGMKLCFSQIPFHKRPLIKKIVEKHGGQYLSNLELKSTTHLVLLYTNGEKFEKAKEVKSIKLVSYEWYVQSLKEGLPLLEKLFPPIENISHIMDELIHLQHKTKIIPFCENKLTPKSQLVVRDENNLKEDQSVLNHPLRGCSIFISNTLLIRKQELKQLIKELGGICVDYLDTSTTHLIVDNLNAKSNLDYQKAQRLSIEIVDINWLTKHKGPDYEKKRRKHFAESFSDFHHIHKRSSNLNIEVITRKKALKVNSNSNDNLDLVNSKQTALRKSFENAQKLEKLLSQFETVEEAKVILSQSKEQPVERVKPKRGKMNLNPCQDNIPESLPVVWDF